MKYFLILLSDKQANELNNTMLKAHIDYLKEPRVEGYLPLCGPFVDNKGAVLVIQADSKEYADH